MFAHQIAHAHVLFAEGVILIKGLVAAMLPGHIGRHIGAARRHADAAVELHAFFHTAVQHARAVNASQAAAHINDTGFHTLPSFSFSTSV